MPSVTPSAICTPSVASPRLGSVSSFEELMHEALSRASHCFAQRNQLNKVNPSFPSLNLDEITFVLAQLVADLLLRHVRFQTCFLDQLDQQGVIG